MTDELKSGAKTGPRCIAEMGPGDAWIRPESIGSSEAEAEKLETLTPERQGEIVAATCAAVISLHDVIPQGSA